MLDNYLAYADGNNSINTPIGSYSSVTGVDYVPNGAFYNINFTNQAGTDLAGLANYADPVNGGNINVVNGVPVGDGVRTAFTIYIRFRATEKLVLSPFIFADTHEYDTGLFGINNIQIVCNLRTPDRVLRNDVTGGALLTDVAYNTSAQGGVFQNSIINTIFLTPSLDVELPPKSVVPYMEFPRYISQPAAAMNAGSTQQLQSQTITLP